MSDFVDDLMDEIESILDTPQVKFNTHRNRKLLMGEIKTAIANSVKENTVPKTPKTLHSQMITRPNPHSPKGFAIMDKADSERADDIHNGFIPPPKPRI